MAVQTLALPTLEAAPLPDMIFVPGGTFRMGSDHHYPEEAPVHRFTVDDFFIDRTPVTNRAFRKFVNATGYVTFAEMKPDAGDYPGALPNMLKAGSLVFTPPSHVIDLGDGAGVLVSGPGVTAKFLETFKEFPPSQRPASFSIDQMQERLQKSFETVGSR